MSTIKKRHYKVKWKFIIEEPMSTNFRKYHNEFFPKWYAFMRRVVQVKLTPNQIRDIPNIRNSIPSNIKTESIYNMVSKKNENLARELIDCAPIFDFSPFDLKVYILAVFGISSSECKKNFATD